MATSLGTKGSVKGNGHGEICGFLIEDRGRPQTNVSGTGVSSDFVTFAWSADPEISIININHRGHQHFPASFSSGISSWHRQRSSSLHCCEHKTLRTYLRFHSQAIFLQQTSLLASLCDTEGLALFLTTPACAREQQSELQPPHINDSDLDRSHTCIKARKAKLASQCK